MGARIIVAVDRPYAVVKLLTRDQKITGVYSGRIGGFADRGPRAVIGRKVHHIVLQGLIGA